MTRAGRKIVSIVSLLALSVVGAAEATPQTVWTRQFGSDATEYGFAVSASNSGVVAIVGSTYGNLAGSATGAGGDAFVRRYKTTGEVGWTRQFGGPNRNEAYAVTARKDSVTVAGMSEDPLFDQDHIGDTDSFVVRYSASGTREWARIFGTTVNEIPNAMDVTSSATYVGGWTGGAMEGTQLGGGDAYLVRFDNSGDDVWTRQFGTTETDRIFGVAATSDAIYVAGTTGGELPGQTTKGSLDGYLRKYNLSGQVKWTRQFGTGESDEVGGIAVGDAGIFVVGTTPGTFPGVKDTGEGYDVFVRKFDSSGHTGWTRQFGSASYENPRGVSSTATRIYVTGSTDGELPGQHQVGGRDAFLRAYRPDGSAAWTRQFGTTNTDEALSISAATSGIYVGGSEYGEFPGQTNGGGGNADAFIRRIKDV